MTNPVIIWNVVANTSIGTNPQVLTSTKVKVAANVHCYVAVGNVQANVRATTSNCFIIPPNVITTVDAGPGNLVPVNNGLNVSNGGNPVGPFISFLSAGPGPAAVSMTEIGSVNFNNVAQ